MAWGLLNSSMFIDTWEDSKLIIIYTWHHSNPLSHNHNVKVTNKYKEKEYVSFHERKMWDIEHGSWRGYFKSQGSFHLKAYFVRRSLVKAKAGLGDISENTHPEYVRSNPGGLL